MTLEEIGKKYGVTRERVRQIVEKANKKIIPFHEEIYVKEFEEYNFSEEDFKLIFNQTTELYNYFKLNFTSGEKSILQYITENTVSEYIKKYIYKRNNIIFFMGKRIELSKSNILSAYIEKMNEYKSLDVIYSDINNILIKYNMKFDSIRDLEGQLARSEWVIASMNHTYRYYNSNLLNENINKKINEMLQLENGVYSTLFLLKNNRDFFDNINIYNEYELHNLLRKYIKIENKSVKLGRMPIFIVGNIEKYDFFYNKIKEYSPMHVDLFLEMLDDEFGLKKDSTKSYLVKEFKNYINIENEISIRIEKIDDMSIAKLKSIINESVYTKENFIELLRSNNIDSNKYFNSMNLSLLGYCISGTYVVKEKYRTINNYLKDRIMSNDFYEIEKNYNTSTYFILLENLNREYDIIKFSSNIYITSKKLKQVGIEKEDIIKFVDTIIDEMDKDEFFTVYFLENRNILTQFEDYGFEDVFFESILEHARKIKRIRYCNTKIFAVTEENFSKIDFIRSILNKYGNLDIYKLVSIMENMYGIKTTKEDLQQDIYNSEFYYDKILEKVFKDKKEYYEEVYE